MVTAASAAATPQMIHLVLEIFFFGAGFPVWALTYSSSVWLSAGFPSNPWGA